MQQLSNFTGQPHATTRLQLAVDSARIAGVACEHTLLAGPPGLGKTTLARLVASEMGGQCVQTSGPALGKATDVIGYFRQVKARDVLFIDEIHAAPRDVLEMLYTPMQDGYLEVQHGQGAAAKLLRAKLPPFTLIGATTHPGLLPRPLRDRFRVAVTLNLYQPEHLAAMLDVVDPIAALAIGQRSRGTPRIAHRLHDSARAYALVNNGGVLTADCVTAAMAMERIDDDGLNDLDRRYLAVLIDHYNGGPAGINAVAAAMGEEPANLADAVEPYLLQQGYVARTRLGRRVLRRGYEKLGRKVDAGGELVASETAEVLL